ncbi:efflux RND transporter periplasmic adaptor subunit [Rheinheimera salexigens]|uniref:Efflux transporter periplasmic adaptor subunit n=1 Tax=Rheinheimera salexigens TaxID=1628148 RepID=A0A1E7Q728_9GAMM|nr:efflux RND transporter periplasmic adaptor subunit [Rheinheimera salexigens]OEY69901.1 efflux transporter periplasmic adaptor subunit [Rheinheimera salexigens]
MNIATLVMAFIVSSVLLGCHPAESAASATKAEDIMAIPIETSLSRKGEISSSYQTTATLETRTETQVISKATGIVTTILVEEGQQVEAGQLLATLDNERQRFSLQKEQAELSRLSSELKRMDEMYQRQLISTDNFEKLKWQYDAALASVNLAQLALTETEIRTPISGVVARRYAKIGQLISQYQTESLFHIVANQQLEAIVYLPEQHLKQAQIGQNAILRFVGSAPMNAELVRISPIVDAASGTVRVVLKVDNSQLQLKPGMFAQVQLQFDIKPAALLIPKRALMITDNVATVFVVSAENTVSRQNVELGYQSDETVEIVSGLTVEQAVVVAGQAALKPDALVNVVAVRQF